MKRLRVPGKPPARKGSGAVPFLAALPVMLGFIGLAIDMSLAYARKTELQQMADAVAVAAANKLDGTRAGVNAANDAVDETLYSLRYGFGERLRWDDQSGVRFAASAQAAEGEWKRFSDIGTDAAAAGLVFAKVNTSELTDIYGAGPGRVSSFFMGVLGVDPQISLDATAIAGPVSVPVTPLAVCALDAAAPVGVFDHPAPLADERLEFGFRRGVSYNLLDISPNFSTPQVYLVNPIDLGGNLNNSAHFASDFVKPFICSGSMGMSHVGKGTTLHVRPLTLDVSTWLNSRFNEFPEGACNRTAAPSDQDIREYTGGYSTWYMGSSALAPYPAHAASTNRSPGGGRVTFADLKAGESGDATPTAESFGPLWTRTRPVTTTGASYATSQWSQMYRHDGVSVPNARSSYPAGSTAVPYMTFGHRVFVSAGERDRRILNIPLLDCSAGEPGAPARVVGIGRFFMTAKANGPARSIPGEFAGALLGSTNSHRVALYK